MPRRPDLAQLRRQAKELRDAARAGEAAALNRFGSHVGSADGQVELSLAQLVVAREHGFPSWARLKAAVGADAAPDLASLVDDFLTASIDGRAQSAGRLLRANPAIATYDISTAAVLGDLHGVQEHVRNDPTAAIRPDARRGWPPLLYACHSVWHRVTTEYSEGILQVVWLLLDTGADPNTNNGRPSRSGYRSALFGATGVANNPAATSLLLRYGANPNDDESLYHAAQHPDLACLRVLLGHGATVAGTNAFAAVIAPGNAEGVRLMLEAGGDPGRRVSAGRLADRTLAPLPLAVADCGVDVVAPLLAAGADPNAVGADHRSVIRTAVRRGNQDVARLLRRYRAHDDTTEVDNFLGACVRADRATVDQLLSVAPGLTRRLTAEDLGALADTAEYAQPAAVTFMLDLGFPINALRACDGATALHAAAYAGRVSVVNVLLARGVDVNARDGQWGSTALAWATVGSGERPRYARDADWVATVRTLLAAGSATDDAWIGGKPPSEEIAALLVASGIDEPDGDD
ncbi:MAG TPA: ankyrin repeat domain-containing protein [Pseudonocardiaceae bacterium]|nr:ankyrin repeat domain-containing protein [Pseudonocardiaceae bacterium]